MDGITKTMTRNIPIAMMRKNSVQEIGDKLVTMLDEIEKRVEHLRESAGVMEQEKEALLELLTTVHMNKDMLRLGHGDREDIAATTDRLLTRCKTVQVSVRTPRNEVQTRALDSVNELIDSLMNKMKMDIDNSKQTCIRFLNACQADEPGGPIDQKFQSSIIECTAEDQKRIRRRLTQMLGVIDRADQTVDQANISQSN